VQQQIHGIVERTGTKHFSGVDKVNFIRQFTRKWFAWANTLFGELILKVYHERPHLLKG